MNNDTIKILNLEGINIDLSKSDVIKQDQTILCIIVLTPTDECCPLCGSKSYVIKDYRNKEITHSISTANPCILLYKARRYKCKDCEKVFYENNPFSSNDEKVSTLTRLMILDSLRSHTSTFTSVAKQYKLTVPTIINIFDSYVVCKRKRLPETICMDEIYTSKLSNASKYACVILDFNTKEIVEIYSSRHKYYLMNRFTEISESERSNVKAVVIDMWDTYRDLTRFYLRNAIVAVDSFHVIKHLNDAIIKIRIRIMEKYDKKKNKLIENDMYYYMLKKFHYFFTKDYNNIYDGEIRVYKINAKWKKDEILKYLLSIDDDLRYAYHLKEKYREFNLTSNYNDCDEEFDCLIEEFCNSYLDEFREFGRLLRHWKIEIKNSFIKVNGRRLSNGAMEGTNSRLKCIIKNANGYKNFERFRNRCMFSINKNSSILGNPIKKSNK